eukprot:781307-Prymnesium_polylepis.1
MELAAGVCSRTVGGWWRHWQQRPTRTLQRLQEQRGHVSLQQPLRVPWVVAQRTTYLVARCGQVVGTARERNKIDAFAAVGLARLEYPVVRVCSGCTGGAPRREKVVDITLFLNVAAQRQRHSERLPARLGSERCELRLSDQASFHVVRARAHVAIEDLVPTD